MTALLLLLLACDAPTPDGDDAAVQDSDAPAEVVYTGAEPSVRADLRMKRWRQISLDLQGALALTEEQICRETGLYDCTDLHVVSMGGVSVDNGIYEPVDELGVTSSLAIERVVLQACYNRLELDRAAQAAGEEAVVFKHIALDGDNGSQGSNVDEATNQITELYRRILARDPEPEEVSALIRHAAGVSADGGGAAEWALMSCFALATSSEALLY